MNQDNLINYLYKMLKNQHFWFVTKSDVTSSWESRPKKYFELDEYGELKNKSKVEKEIKEYIGDGAETISEAVALFIADNVCEGSITTTDFLNMNFKDKPVEYSENAVEVKNIEPKYIEPQITVSNKQVESKQLNETYYNELPSKTGKDLNDFKSMLDTLNNNGKHSRRGKWNIGNGGYDLWYEIYYNGLPVIQCINGKVNNITDEEVFEFYAKLFADFCDYEYDGEIIESKQLNEISTRVPETEVQKKSTNISENLNTGILPIVDVDLYSKEEIIPDSVDSYKDLDEIIKDIASPYIEEVIQTVLPSAKVNPTGVFHPREYNFSGDELEFDLNVNVDEYNELKDKVISNSEFEQYLKDNYSSGSGFISFMANNINEFNLEENWKQVVQVIMFALRNYNFDNLNDKYLDDFLDAIYEEFGYDYLDESKKQEDIFDDVTNGKATYGVYNDKDERNLKDRYKEPTYAKRNKIRNFKDDKFTQRSIRDIINKGVTHVDYEKMPNERVQAYKNSKKEEDYFDKMDKLRKDAENKMINSLKKEFPEAKVSDVIESKYAGDRILLTNNGKRVTIYFMDEQGEDGKPWFMVIKNKANKESYSGNIKDIIKYIKTNIFNAIKKVENVQRRLNEENNKSLNVISQKFQEQGFDANSKAGQIVIRTSNLFNALSDKGYDVNVSFDNGESTSSILLGQQGGQVLITITDTNQPLKAYANGSFELNKDNLEIFEDLEKELQSL